MSAVLVVRDLCKTFTLHTIDGRTVVSLRGVNLSVAAGEHVAVAGPNGAGKSSLLRCVHRTYRPDSGSVALHLDSGPVELTSLPDRAMARLRGREICYVSQFLETPPRAGALEVVADAARRRGLDFGEAAEAAAVSLRRLGGDEALWGVDCGGLFGGGGGGGGGEGAPPAGRGGAPRGGCCCPTSRSPRSTRPTASSRCRS